LGGLDSHLVGGFLQTQELVFLMISSKLLDSWPVFLLVLSPIKTAHLLILFWPSGDDYSQLCSPKSSFRGTGESNELFI
jgi:hypothetical protein